LTFSPTDESYMRNALALAAKGRGRTSPNPMVGAVIVKQGKVVGRGFHQRAGADHAEIVALTEAGEDAAGATLYCTLEPCCHHGRTPPCTEAIVQADVKRVVVASIDPSAKVRGKGIAALTAAGVEVSVGCLAEEAGRLNEFFNVFHEWGRPFVTLKWAMTLDGRTGTDTNHSRWISNEKSRQYVHKLRAEHDAILIGIGTILADDPMLDVRIEGYDGPQPRRVILDGNLAIPRRARVLRERRGGAVILIATAAASKDRRAALEEDGHRVVVLPGRRRLIDVRKLMDFLTREEILSVLCEGGRQIETALLQEGVVDKIVAFIAPKIIGGRSLRSPVENLGLTLMDQAIQLKRTRWQAFDEDLCLEGYLREI
jgi:diaminohydroxyphosphoribosylaminopyrimidine deaminase/5-amino-6-(5-phosphoribosylamino)uracil reductase